MQPWWQHMRKSLLGGIHDSSMIICTVEQDSSTGYSLHLHVVRMAAAAVPLPACRHASQRNRILDYGGLRKSPWRAQNSNARCEIRHPLLSSWIAMVPGRYTNTNSPSRSRHCGKGGIRSDLPHALLCACLRGEDSKSQERSLWGRGF